MSLRLRSKARLVRRARTGQTLLMYPERALELNASATEIVELCDGTRSAEDIVATILQRHPDASPDAIRRYVETFLTELEQRALVRI